MASKFSLRAPSRLKPKEFHFSDFPSDLHAIRWNSTRQSVQIVFFDIRRSLLELEKASRTEICRDGKNWKKGVHRSDSPTENFPGHSNTTTVWFAHPSTSFDRASLSHLSNSINGQRVPGIVSYTQLNTSGRCHTKNGIFENTELITLSCGPCPMVRSPTRKLPSSHIEHQNAREQCLLCLYDLHATDHILWDLYVVLIRRKHLSDRFMRVIVWRWKKTPSATSSNDNALSHSSCPGRGSPTITHPKHKPHDSGRLARSCRTRCRIPGWRFYKSPSTSIVDTPQSALDFRMSKCSISPSSPAFETCCLMLSLRLTYRRRQRVQYMFVCVRLAMRVPEPCWGQYRLIIWDLSSH